SSASGMSISVAADMYLPPVLEQFSLRILDRSQRAPLFRVVHPGAPDDLRATVTANDDDLRQTVASHVNVGRLMVIHEDEDAQAMVSQHHDHAATITQRVRLFQPHSGSENSRSRLRSQSLKLLSETMTMRVVPSGAVCTETASM